MSHSAGVSVSHNLAASQTTYLQNAYSVTAILICSSQQNEAKNVSQFTKINNSV